MLKTVCDNNLLVCEYYKKFNFFFICTKRDADINFSGEVQVIYQATGTLQLRLHKLFSQSDWFRAKYLLYYKRL